MDPSDEIEIEIESILAQVDELITLAPWWRGWARPITEAEIARFEAAHAVTLPPGYRQLLLSLGDHAPLPARPGGALAPLAEARSLPVASAFIGPLASPFAHTGDAALELEWDEDADDYSDPQWLRGCLPLTGAGCDEIYVLVVSGPDRGRVWGVTPSGSPELHPTGLPFTRWYQAELERGLAPERKRVHELAQLERRLAADPDDVEAAVSLGRALLVEDRARAASLIEHAWAIANADPKVDPKALGLDRAIAELDLLTGRADRVDKLADQDGPWLRAHAAIAAARRGDDARALELFAVGGHPATLGQLVAGYHALALQRSGQPRRALEVLRGGATSLANRALSARIHTQLGELDAARRGWTRIRLGLTQAPEPTPRRALLADFIALPKPALSEVEAELSELGELESDDQPG